MAGTYKSYCVLEFKSVKCWERVTPKIKDTKSSMSSTIHKQDISMRTRDRDGHQTVTSDHNVLNYKIQYVKLS